jgi:hypothetical protein
MRTLIVLAWLLGAAAMSSPAFAWGDVGHRVICQIAYEELKPEIKSRVDALVAIDPKFRTFPDGCTWPDVFPRQRPPEHFVDLPRTAKGIEVAHPCPVADRCVISAILNDTRDLAFSLDVSDQLRLLKSLGHWVGDVHQPLHVSFDDDRGGNLVAIEGPCSKSNLHTVWDKCIIEKKIGLDYADVAAKLRAEITDEDRAQWVPLSLGPMSPLSLPKGRMFNIASRKRMHAGMPPISLNTRAALKGLSRSMTLIWPRKPQRSGTDLSGPV